MSVFYRLMSYVILGMGLGVVWSIIATQFIAESEELLAQRDAVFLLTMFAGAAATLIAGRLWFSAPSVLTYLSTVALSSLGAIVAWRSGLLLADLQGWDLSLGALSVMLAWPLSVSLLTFIVALVQVWRLSLEKNDPAGAPPATS